MSFLLLYSNSSAHAICNPALRASKLIIVSGLFMNGRSAHKQSRMLVHASMIRLRDCLWLNCYIVYYWMVAQSHEHQWHPTESGKVQESIKWVYIHISIETAVDIMGIYPEYIRKEMREAIITIANKKDREAIDKAYVFYQMLERGQVNFAEWQEGFKRFDFERED